jgi:hypothetical protein
MISIQPILTFRKWLAGLAIFLLLASCALCREISLSENEAQAGDVVMVPMLLDDATGVATIQCQVNYDSQLLLLNGATNLPGSLGDSFDLFWDGSEDGVVNVILSRKDGLSLGSGVIVSLEFTLASGVAPGTCAELVIANTGFGDQYGGDLALTAAVSPQDAGVWATMSAAVDSDSDGLSDYAEQMMNGSPDYDPGGTDTDIDNPDTDGDGYTDGAEVAAGSDPLNASESPANLQSPGTLFYGR